MSTPPGTPATPPQTECPFCRSTQIASAGKTTNDASYWRCRDCGQIWNPARLVSPRDRSRNW